MACSQSAIKRPLADTIKIYPSEWHLITDSHDYLMRNDSYTFFKTINGLVITGPTGTNVMDMQLILLEN